MAKFKKYVLKIKKLWIQTWVRLYRKANPKYVVKRDLPKWGNGKSCEVLRHARAFGGFVWKKTAARVDQINKRTVWVRFSDGGFGKFKRNRVLIKGL